MVSFKSPVSGLLSRTSSSFLVSVKGKRFWVSDSKGVRIPYCVVLLGPSLWKLIRLLTREVVLWSHSSIVDPPERFLVYGALPTTTPREALSIPMSTDKIE